MKKNILINATNFYPDSLKIFTSKIKNVESINKVYIATWRKEILDYRGIADNIEFIVYPNSDENKYADKFHDQFISNNPELENRYDFEPESINGFDFCMQVFGYRRFMKGAVDKHFNVNSVRLGIDVYNYFFNLFKTKEINLVLGVIQEHSSSDAMLYKAAVDSSNVDKVLVTKALGLSNPRMQRFFMYDYKNNTPFEIPEEFKGDNSFKGDILFGDRGIEKFFESKIENFKNIAFRSFKKPLKITPNKLYRFIFRRLVLKMEEFIFFKNLRKLERHYEKLCSEIDFNKKYILYSLHREPESSIYPADGINSLQLYNIKIISSCLPKGWKVYVKEHPSQFKNKSYVFNPSVRVCLFSFKNKEYYDYLNKIPNVEIVSMNVSQKKLVEDAQIIASNSGTVFLEASVVNKPCLVFGKKNFLDMFNNIWKVSSVQDCKKALDIILSTKNLDSNYQEIIDKYTGHVNEQSCYLQYFPNFLIKLLE